VIVLIDDIDRLLPSEMVDIFRMVRSVGDLPNVHYVLAFRPQRGRESSEPTFVKTDGARYLEKIVRRLSIFHDRPQLLSERFSKDACSEFWMAQTWRSLTVSTGVRSSSTAFSVSANAKGRRSIDQYVGGALSERSERR